MNSWSISTYSFSIKAEFFLLSHFKVKTGFLTLQCNIHYDWKSVLNIHYVPSYSVFLMHYLLLFSQPSEVSSVTPFHRWGKWSMETDTRGVSCQCTQLVGDSGRSPKPTLLTIWKLPSCNRVRYFYKEMLSCCHWITRRMTEKMTCVCVCVCVCACSLTESYSTLCDPMDCSPPGSSVK